MNTEDNNQGVGVDASNDNTQDTNETISVSKSDYEKLTQTLGSLRRELKDLKKVSTKEDVSSETKPVDNKSIERVEKLALRQANITHPDDIELARKTAKKWNMDIEDVLVDDTFTILLDKERTKRNNIEATTNIKGQASTNQAKNTPEYWIAKGVPPSPQDVPDRKVRATIARAMMDSAKTSKRFYND